MQYLEHPLISRSKAAYDCFWSRQILSHCVLNLEPQTQSVWLIITCVPSLVTSNHFEWISFWYLLSSVTTNNNVWDTKCDLMEKGALYVVYMCGLGVYTHNPSAKFPPGNHMSKAAVYSCHLSGVPPPLQHYQLCFFCCLHCWPLLFHPIFWPLQSLKWNITVQQKDSAEVAGRLVDLLQSAVFNRTPPHTPLTLPTHPLFSLACLLGLALPFSFHSLAQTSYSLIQCDII